MAYPMAALTLEHPFHINKMVLHRNALRMETLFINRLYQIGVPQVPSGFHKIKWISSVYRAKHFHLIDMKR